MRVEDSVIVAAYLDEVVVLLDEMLAQVFVEDGKAPNTGTVWLSERAYNRHVKLDAVRTKILAAHSHVAREER